MPIVNRQFGWAWLALTASLGLHVLDEGLHDFLSVYNPNAQMIREYLGIGFPPVFTWPEWWTGLISAVVLLAVAGRWAFFGARWFRLAASIYGVLMVANAAGHFAGSVYWSRMMPGVWSSPLLLAASIWLLVESRKQPRAAA